MIIALLFFALASAFTAAATVSLMGFSFWIALVTYPLAGALALLFGAALVALHNTTALRPAQPSSIDLSRASRSSSA
ncbi:MULTISPECIES: hypothetical protein [Pacificibacter]|uniref:hypothetical protein n=1 Tax=Pacificibacter TaxID=1042323 RepID=UPI001C08D2CD|nr:MULTISPECIES: hypothetical protein [Pacificibacter]MBU2937574.1 hypothetical protein [Pacificibacter marinus]MDO6616705.1 hypothetical protein [Pacificibacter sp. 1_MG-2023]